MKKLSTAGGPAKLSAARDDVTSAQASSKGMAVAKPRWKLTGVAGKRKANNRGK